MALFGGNSLDDTISWNNSTVKGYYDVGAGNVNSGLAGLRDLDTRYNDLLSKGGLTPDLQRQFDVARGYLGDQYVRSGRSLAAALAARRAQSGGALTPGAVAEMEKQSGQNRDEQFFDASNNLAMDKATMSYNSTKDLYSRIEDIRKTITQTGLTQEQQALLARLQLAALRQQKRSNTQTNVTHFLGSVVQGVAGGA